MRTEIRLRLIGLSASLGPRRVLSDVSFCVSPGETVAISGANGSGKSTLASVIAGILLPTRGTVFLDDWDVTNCPPWDRKQRGLRYMPQEDRVFRTLSVRENVALLSNLDRRPELFAKSARSGFDISWIARSWRSPAGNLSGGQQAFLSIWAASRSASSLLMLDEPTAGLDDEMVPLATEAVRAAGRRGVATVIFEHRTEMSKALHAREMTLVNGTLV
jgi:ABC-type branched-subunit amino acid transport system ATPase component